MNPSGNFEHIAAAVSLRSAGVLAAVTLLMGPSGCSVEQNEGYARATQGSAAAFPPGACKLYPFDSPEQKRKSAERCIPAMEAGSVAIVAAGVSLESAQTVANDLVTQVKAATGGLITVSATPIPASAEVGASVETMSCIDYTNTDNMVAVKADIAMPTLREADFVVALTDKPACKRSTGGTANIRTNRHADIYNVTSHPADLTEAGTSAGHELLHLYLLGHSGWLHTSEAEQTTLQNATVENPADLMTFIRGGNYKEYDGGAMRGDIMGKVQGFDPQDITCNPVHKAKLMWPQIIRGERVSPEHKLEAGNSIQLGAEAQAAAEQFAALPLARSIILQDGGYPAKTFDTLNIIPIVKNGEITGARLMLSDKHSNVVEIAALKSTSNPIALTYEGQRITLDIKKRSLDVSHG